MDTIFNITTYTAHGDFIRQSRFFDKASAIAKANECAADEPGIVAIVTEIDQHGSAYTTHRAHVTPRPTVSSPADLVAAFKALPMSDQQAVVIELIKGRIATQGGLVGLLGL